MKKLFTYICCICLSLSTYAQLAYQKAYGGSNIEFGFDLCQASDSNFYIAGLTSSIGAGSFDLLVVKTDKNGNLIWTSSYGGGSLEQADAVVEALNGDIVVAGYTSSIGAGFSSAYILRLDTAGTIIWEKTYGGAVNEKAHDIIALTDSGFFVVGETNGFGAGNDDGFAMRLDKNGDTLWTKSFGGVQFERGFSATQTADLGFAVVGMSSSFTGGNEDIYLIKFDGGGNKVWSMIYGGASHDRGLTVQETIDGGFIIGGFTQSFDNHRHGGDSKAYLLKTDNLGEVEWSQVFGVDSNENEILSLVQGPDSAFYVSGFTKPALGNYKILLTKFNNGGELSWARTIGNGLWNFGYGLVLSANDLFIGGYSSGYGNNEQTILIKTTDNGQLGCFDSDAVIVMRDTIPPSLSPNDSVVSISFIIGNSGTVVNNTLLADTTVCDDYCPEAAFTTNAPWICQGDSLWLFNQSAAGALSYNWFRNGVLFSTATNPAIKLDTLGTDTIMLVAIHPSCQDTSFQILDVISPSSITAIFGTQLNVNTVTFTDSSLYAMSWLYNFGDGNSSNLQNTSHTFSDTGDFSVCLTVNNFCGSDSSCQLINIPCVFPVANFGYTSFGLDFTFADLSSYATSWAWSFGDGDSAFVQNPTHTYTTAGTYSVVLNISNACGVDLKLEMIVASGINTHSPLSQLRVYPNPSIDMVIIEGPAQPYQLTLLNMLGVTVQQGDFEGRVELQLDELAPGIYLLEFKIGAYKHSRRLVISRK